MKRKKIGIINYGYGNIFSVKSAIQEINHQPILSDKLNELNKCDKLILPGVGAYGDAIKVINKKKINDILYELVVNKKRDLLGICLGFQLLGKSSEEMGSHLGLNFLDFHVEKFSKSKLHIPHIGWNSVNMKKNDLFKNIPNNSLFYFVHSFCVKKISKNIVIGKTKYIDSFASILNYKNIYATQFHPEKSQLVGLTLLKNFIKL